MSSRVVTPAEWRLARRELLEKEKELTRQSDEMAKQRADMPMVKVDQTYIFTTLDGEKILLADMFEGRRQLIVNHVMFAPEWDRACTGCTYMVDHFPRQLDLLNSRDTTLALVSRAPVDKLAAYRKERDWKYPWYSSEGSMFNYDFHATQDESLRPVEFNFMDKAELETRGKHAETKGDVPGFSAFIRDPVDGAIYFTYSTWARGVDHLLMTLSFLDLTPLGRQNEKYGKY